MNADPWRLGTPFCVPKISLSKNGTPANGPLSGNFAAERARSYVLNTTAFSFELCRSIREIASSTSSAAETSFLATNSAKPSAS